MKLTHFNQFKPLCPVCLKNLKQSFPLELSTIKIGDDRSITEGILLCSNQGCKCEYPIIDGIPIIVENIRTYISSNIISIINRNDLSGEIKSLIGDCCGPGSSYDISRQYLSTYAFDHYADLDPQNISSINHSLSSVNELFQNSINLMDEPIIGPAIDIGCSVGRGTFELAEKSKSLTLGIDINFDMLKFASRVLSNSEVNYPLRRVGIAYDEKKFDVKIKNQELIDFWVMDGSLLPFENNTFNFALSLNLLDCLSFPYEHLKILGKIIKPKGKAIISTPFDWSNTATPIEAWLGGHSQRSINRGDSKSILKNFLSNGDHPYAIKELCLLKESDASTWRVRLHERSQMLYQAYIILLEIEKPF